MMGMDWKTILIVAAIGVVFGWLADALTGSRRMLSAMGVGLVGGFLGAFIARVTAAEFAGPWTEDTLAAVGAAFLLITMAAVRRRV
jgi:uncharacterized membrane protein YeaQ/YmgE (transglycosylase-associated protein family)